MPSLCQRGFWRGLALAAALSGIMGAVPGELLAAPPAVAPSVTAATPSEAPEPPEAPEPSEPPEHRFFVALDSVIGVGQWALLDTRASGASYVDSAPFTTLSLLPSGVFRITNDFALSARMPVTIARFAPSGYDARTAVAAGNLEVGASLTLHLVEDAPVIIGLDVDLPTAQGTQFSSGYSYGYGYAYIPRPSAALAADYDRYSANAAASALRGWESIALFEDDTVGISPRVFVPWHPIPRLFLGPWVKLENLLATNGGSNIYSADVVAGLRADYLVVQELDMGARFWIDAPLHERRPNAGQRGHRARAPPPWGVVHRACERHCTLGRAPVDHEPPHGRDAARADGSVLRR